MQPHDESVWSRASLKVLWNDCGIVSLQPRGRTWQKGIRRTNTWDMNIYRMRNWIVRILMSIWHWQSFLTIRLVFCWIEEMAAFECPKTVKWALVQPPSYPMILTTVRRKISSWIIGWTKPSAFYWIMAMELFALPKTSRSIPWSTQWPPLISTMMVRSISQWRTLVTTRSVF